MQAVDLIVTLLSIYVLLGVLFAVPFVSKGVGRVDPIARESTIGLRLIAVPGAVALWPFLLLKWIRAH